MNGKLKSLNINSVQEVAEDLMNSNGSTTTLEVKKKLRASGFFALQAEVSAAMDFLAYENEWTFSSNGQYRTYHFGEDTALAFYCSMEKGEQFWEISVKDKFQIIRLGKKNGRGNGIFTHRYESNRQAINEASRLLKHRKSDGYQIMTDKNEWAPIIIDHFSYLEKQAIQCTLFYHSITKIEQQKALFNVNGLPQPGMVQIIKKAGYEFTFDLSTRQTGQLIKQLLSVKEWDAAKVYEANAVLLGEKDLKQDAMLYNGKPAAHLPIVKESTQARIANLEVNNQNLYRMDIQFSDGSQLILRKDQFESTKTLLNLAEILLLMS